MALCQGSKRDKREAMVHLPELMLTATRVLNITDKKSSANLHNSVLMRNAMDKVVMEHPLQFLSSRNIRPVEMHKFVQKMIHKGQTTLTNVEKDLELLQSLE